MQPGQNLSHYRMIRRIGSGGMGEVYEALDTKLDRRVALKVLRDSAPDERSRERFIREARAASALNHQGIVTIYEFGHDAGVDFIAMEFIDGEPLSEKLREPLATRIGYLRQAADAMAAAHKAGIIHRDLKPSNIMVTREGLVKVLDFGLARESSRTQNGLTDESLVIGTPAYMSPEQAQGQPLGLSSDVFSFGVILYEMVCGVRPFGGRTTLATLQQIAHHDPNPPEAVNPGLPGRMGQLISECLRKSPEARPQTMAQVARELNGDLSTLRIPPAARPGRTSAIAIGAAVAVMLASGFYVSLRRNARETRLDVATPPLNDPASFALSPDGTRIAYTAVEGGAARLWVRDLKSGKASPIDGTSGALFPFWSPDGLSLGFFADGLMKRVGSAGGVVTTLANTPHHRGATWSAEGIILFNRHSMLGLYRIPAAGGEMTPVTELTPDETGHRWPQFLPDGKHFLYYIDGKKKGTYWRSLEGGQSTFLVSGESNAVYLPQGWLVWQSQGQVLARRLNAATGELSGQQVVIEQRTQAGTVDSSSALSASANGTLAWRAGKAAGHQLVWFSPQGKRLGDLGPPDSVPLSHPSISRDGRKIAVTRGTDAQSDIWIYQNGSFSRWTSSGHARWPALSPDGKIAWVERANGTGALFVQSLDGSVPTKLNERGTVGSWSPDGRLAFMMGRAPGKKPNGDISSADIIVYSLADGKVTGLVDTPAAEFIPAVSPDGKWFAYHSDESGRFEVYVRPFPGPGGVWQVSSEGARYAHWSPDGRELYFVSLDRRLMAVRVQYPGGKFTPGPAEERFPVFDVSAAPGAAPFDVAPDRRLLVAMNVPDSSAPINLLMNWRPPK